MDKKTIKQLQKLLDQALINFATKDDLKNFATKDDLKNLVTKDDLKQELAKYPTKDDLKNSFEKQSEDFGEVVSELFTKTDEKKADRTDVDHLDKRVTRIE